MRHPEEMGKGARHVVFITTKAGPLKNTLLEKTKEERLPKKLRAGNILNGS